MRLGPEGIARVRALFFKKWLSRADGLKAQEKELRDTMDPVVANAIKQKRILVFKELLIETGFPDLGVCDELLKGAELTGEVHKTGMLPAKFSPPLLTEDMLAKQSELGARQPVLSSGDDETDREVWRQTMEEVSKGWLKGPFDRNQVPVTAPISRRFGLKQKAKTRLIDDFAASGVNGTVTVFEAPVLRTIDIAAALVSIWFERCSDMNVDSSLETRTFDLKSAYRQVALSEAGRAKAFIKVYCPETKEGKLFQCQVLPFGATRSVHPFLRLARAIWWIGVRACKILWTSFYDDYIVFTSPELSKSTECTVTMLLRLLGWEFAESGKKAGVFGPTCEALGVLIDLGESARGICHVANTANRISELAADLTQVLDEGAITKSQAQRLRGRMLFAESQLFGRCARNCLRVLTNRTQVLKSKVAEGDAFFLRLFVRQLQQGAPRTVRANMSDHIVIMTDACYERESKDWISGIGGVLIDPQEGRKEFFSFELNAKHRKLLGEEFKRQLIFEAETLASVVAFALWANAANGRRCLNFVDNEGTKLWLLRQLDGEPTCNEVC